MSVGVEIEATSNTPANHLQKAKAIQSLKVRTTQKFEKTKVRVKNPNGGQYRIIFTNPDLPAGKYNYSDLITDNWSADMFKKMV